MFYIIKENRTYDQVLGDVQGGNGDTSLVLFGKNITPNQHALVNEFVLLDNFYVDAEVSADGHNWSHGWLMPTIILKKPGLSYYGSRGGTYDYEGQEKSGLAQKRVYLGSLPAAGIATELMANLLTITNQIFPCSRIIFVRTYTSWDQRVQRYHKFSQWKREFDSLVSRKCGPTNKHLTHGQ